MTPPKLVGRGDVRKPIGKSRSSSRQRTSLGGNLPLAIVVRVVTAASESSKETAAMKTWIIGVLAFAFACCFVLHTYSHNIIVRLFIVLSTSTILWWCASLIYVWSFNLLFYSTSKQRTMMKEIGGNKKSKWYNHGAESR